MLESLDAAAVRRWCAAGLRELRRHQREIDELNVYPVPDGDTGTNLLLTIVSAHDALAAEADGDGGIDGGPDGGPDTVAEPGEITRLGRVLACMARGALLGARGNSGVILAQLLRGLADALACTPRARGRAVAAALAQAAAGAYAAVSHPAEGTVLTVAQGAARAAAAADSDDLATVVRAAATGASVALAKTPSQLPALARAGVVDAGGRGLVLLLDALVEVVTGTAPATAPLAAMASDPRLLTVAREAGDMVYGYEVEYLLDAPQPAVDTLKQALAALGDSLVVVGTGLSTVGHPTWNVHVHVNDVGAAIEAGIAAGRPHRIAVTRFADQVVAGRAAPPVSGRGVIAVAQGAGLAALFTAGGATVVPDTSAVPAALAAADAGQIVLLPNDESAHAAVGAAAEQARGAGGQVGVVPTRSPIQGLAALAVRDPDRRFEDDVIAMAEAAGACRCAEVEMAADGVVALVEGQARLVGVDPAQVCLDLLDLLLNGGGELVTVVLGAAAPATLDEQVRGHLRECWPGVDVQVHQGGQPRYALLVGVE